MLGDVCAAAERFVSVVPAVDCAANAVSASGGVVNADGDSRSDGRSDALVDASLRTGIAWIYSPTVSGVAHAVPVTAWLFTLACTWRSESLAGAVVLVR